MSVPEDVLSCDVCFNDQLLVDVKIARTCNVGNIVQGLWDDSKFRQAAIKFLETNQQQQQVQGSSEQLQATKCTLKSFHNLDRSILRAYVAIRFLPAWKWLELKDFIADFESKKETVTVSDVFGSFCSQGHRPILRVVPKRESEADDHEVKTIVQELLQTKSLATLSATGCPLSKGMLSLIGQDKYSCTISYDKREKFVDWLRRQDFSEDVIASKRNTESHLQPMTPFKIAKSRVTYEPDGELSRLVCWFDGNPRPGKELIEQYTIELNKNRCGRSKRMLTAESIAVWFKNRRAKARKEESTFPDPWGRDVSFNNESELKIESVDGCVKDTGNGDLEHSCIVTTVENGKEPFEQKAIHMEAGNVGMSDGNNHSSVPDGNNHSSVPDGSNHSSVPDGSNQSSVPDGSNQSTVPDGSNQSSVPDGNNHSSVPDGSNHSSAPHGSNQSTVPDGSNQMPMDGEQNTNQTQSLAAVCERQGSDEDALYQSTNVQVFVLSNNATQSQLMDNVRPVQDENVNKTDSSPCCIIEEIQEVNDGPQGTIMDSCGVVHEKVDEEIVKVNGNNGAVKRVNENVLQNTDKEERKRQRADV